MITDELTPDARVRIGDASRTLYRDTAGGNKRTTGPAERDATRPPIDTETGTVSAAFRYVCIDIDYTVSLPPDSTV